MEEDKIWIAGGIKDDGEVASTEILKDGVITGGPDLPTPAAKHCMVKVSDTEYILAGGKVNLDGVWMYDDEYGLWSVLDKMSVPRIGLGCGLVKHEGKRLVAVE